MELHRLDKLFKMSEKTLELARELGFQAYIDPEGYYGYADIGREGKNSWPFFVTLDVFQPVILPRLANAAFGSRPLSVII